MYINIFYLHKAIVNNQVYIQIVNNIHTIRSKCSAENINKY